MEDMELKLCNLLGSYSIAVSKKKKNLDNISIKKKQSLNIL